MEIFLVTHLLLMILSGSNCQLNKCGSSISFKNCGPSQSTAKVFSRHAPLEIVANYKHGICQTPHQYIWELTGPNTDKFTATTTEYVYKIPPKSLNEYGIYTLSLTIPEFLNDKSVGDIKAQCFLKPKSEKPLAVITGGTLRQIKFGESVLIDGRSSVNVDNEDKPLFYEWSCTVKGVANKGFCEKKQTLSSFTIPSKFLDKTAEYTFTLKVKAYPDGPEGIAQQVVIIFDMDQLSIVCILNCKPETNPKGLATFEVKCNGQCKPSRKYKWKIDKADFQMETSTEISPSTEILKIKKNVLKSGESYKLTVEPTDPLDSVIPGEYLIKTSKKIKLISCKVVPPNGISLETKFKADCQYEPPGSYTFEIFTVKNGVTTLLKTGNDLDKMEFLLSPGYQVMVQIRDRIQSTDTKICDVTVKSVDKDIKNLTEALNDKYMNQLDSTALPNLVNKNNTHALDSAHNMLHDIEQGEETGGITQNEAMKLDVQALKELNKIVIENPDQAKHILQMSRNIANKYGEKPVGEIAKLSTEICKHASSYLKTYLEGMSKDERTFHYEDTLKNLMDAGNCSLAGRNVNEDALTERTLTIPVRTPTLPTIREIVFTEDYAEYVNDEDAIRNKYGFNGSVQNLIQICYSNAKALSLTMGSEKQTLYVKGKLYDLVVAKGKGEEMKDTQLSSYDVDLKPPPDIMDSDHIYSVMLCTTKKDPFWWSKNLQVFSTVAIVSFYDETADKMLQSFKKPFYISFNDTSGMASKMNVGRQFTVPCKNCTDQLLLIRFSVRGNLNYIISFVEFVGNIQLYFRMYQKPSIEFINQQTPHVVNNEKTSKITLVERGYNYLQYYYMAVRGKGTFKLAYTIQSCFGFGKDVMQWEPLCPADGDLAPNRVVCDCDHLTAITPYVRNVDYREEPNAIEIDFYIPFCKYFLIYLVLLSVIIVYFLLIVFCLMKQKKQNIFFLGDVSWKARYAYLVSVHTGKRHMSGTTSNVVLTIHGSLGRSVPHVLNYPDPEKRLLQTTQENWFVLGTQRHLGVIEKIDVSVDWVGTRPSWYCFSIQIFDMQLRKYYIFHVNQWFNVLDMESNVFTIYPSVEFKPEGFNNTFLNTISLASAEANFWNFNHNYIFFSPQRRLTIIFSSILSMMVFNVFLYGVPKFELTDCFSKRTKIDFHWEIFIWGILSAILSFGFHFVLIYMFRKQTVRKELDETNGSTFSTKTINLICWIILVFNIVASIVFLGIFGHWVAPITQLLWLLSLAVGVVFNFFVLENAARIINTFLFKSFVQVKYIFEAFQGSLQYINRQRKELYKTFGRFILRPYLQNLYKPLTKERLDETKRKQKIRFAISIILEDVILFLIYITLLYVIILHEKDPLSYESTNEITQVVQQMVIKPDEDIEQMESFDDIQTLENIYNYTLDSLVFTIQSGYWYGRYYVDNPGMIANMHCKYLGVMRIRQQRVTTKYCNIPPPMKSLNLTCIPEFAGNQETKDFGENWQEPSEVEQHLRMGSAWWFRKSGFGPTLIRGTLANYPGNGFIALLGRTMKNSVMNLEYVSTHNWLDDKTRMISIEFLIYNANTNLFNSVSIIFEISATGYIKRSIQVSTERFLFASFTVMTLTIYICFVVTLFLISRRVYRDYKEDHYRFCSNFWNFFDIMIIAISVIAIVLYGIQRHYIKEYIEILVKAKHNAFVEYHHIFELTTFLTMISAILICFSIIRLWKILRFMIIFQVMEKTVLLSMTPVSGACFCWSFLVGGYSIAGYIQYGYRMNSFRTIPKAFMELILMSLNLNSELHDEFPFETYFDYVYYTSFSLISLYYLTFFIAIICMSYADSREMYVGQRAYPIVRYVWEECLFYKIFHFARCRGRLRAGQSGDDPPLVQAVDKESDLVMMPYTRMIGMIYATRCVLEQTLGMMSETRKFELMEKTVASLLGNVGSCREKFFTHRNLLIGGKVTLVDDRRLLKMEKIVNIILSDKYKSVDEQELEEKETLYNEIMRRHEEKLKFLSLYLCNLNHYSKQFLKKRDDYYSVKLQTNKPILI